MYVNALPACLWISALIFALSPVIELRGEAGERAEATSERHADPFDFDWQLIALPKWVWENTYTHQHGGAHTLEHRQEHEETHFRYKYTLVL